MVVKVALFWGRLTLSIPYGHKEQSCNVSSLMPFNIVQSTSSHCGARTQFVKSYVKSPIHCSRLASFSLKRVEGKMKLNETEKRMFDKADCILSSRLEKEKLYTDPLQAYQWEHFFPQRCQVHQCGAFIQKHSIHHYNNYTSRSLIHLSLYDFFPPHKFILHCTSPPPSLPGSP